MKTAGYAFASAIVLGLVALSMAPAAEGHHSFASEFDAEKPIQLSGFVTKVEWMNPHVWFYLDVTDEETGEVRNWGFEMGAPHQLQGGVGAVPPSIWATSCLLTAACPGMAVRG